MITYYFAIELIFISKNNGVFPEKATDVKSVLGRSVLLVFIRSSLNVI
jgi:hypothetical protein